MSENNYMIDDTYMEELGGKLLIINPMPEKICYYDCVFCPVGHTVEHSSENRIFEWTKGFMEALEKSLISTEADLVAIDSSGEPVMNRELTKIFKLIKKYDKKIYLPTNGYFLNDKVHREGLMLCDEINIEMMVANEEDYRKIHRPVKGMTFEKLLENYKNFKEWFPGKLNLQVFMARGLNDDEKSIEVYKDVIRMLKPDDIIVSELAALGDFEKVWGIIPERLEKIKNDLTDVNA